MRRTALSLLVLGALLTGCGSDEPEPAAEGGATATTASAFPVTVEHRYGTTTVRAAPKRIAVVGLTEQDVVLALGEKPIATTEWYGDQPYAVWPWAREALGDAKPTVLKVTDGFEFEKIASLRPDLIVGTNSGMERADYDKLSAIAPTLPGVRGGTDYFSRWDEQTELIARAMGKAQEGRKLVEDIEASYAKAAAEHPELAGKTVTFLQNAFYDGLIYAYPPGLNTEFLTMLGLTIDPDIEQIDHKPGEQVGISRERFDLADADLMVFATEKPSDVPALEKIPTFGRLSAVREHRAVFTDGTLAGAMYFMSPLSLPYVLERLTPQLAAAAKGEAPRKVVAAGG
jgi:iron complex transport system substrate-binding protein